MSSDFHDRLKSFELSLRFIESSAPLAAEDLVPTLGEFTTSKGYPSHQLLEDFMQSAPLDALEFVHELIKLYPVVMDSPESTKMSILKIYNLFDRRSRDNFCFRNAALFKVLVAHSVKLSDRSGINLKGEKGRVHLRLFNNQSDSDPSRRLLMSIIDLQSMLYSSDFTVMAMADISKTLTAIFDSFSSFQHGSDKPPTVTNGHFEPPTFLIDQSKDTIDIKSALIILVQCLILIELIGNSDLHAKGGQLSQLLQSFYSGTRLSTILKALSNSDARWKYWKKSKQGSEIPSHQKLALQSLSPETSADLHMCVTSALIPGGSGLPLVEKMVQYPDRIGSQWGLERQKILE